VGIFDHQMAIERNVWQSFSHRGPNRRTNRDVRHEVSVHDVDVQHGAAAFDRGFRLLTEAGKIGGKGRWGQVGLDDPPRFAGSLYAESPTPRQKFTLRF